jgi:hypothetical protein
MKFSDLVAGGEALQPGVFNRAVIEDYAIFDFHVTDMLGVKTKIVRAEVASPDKKVYKVVVQFNQVEGPVSEENNVVVRCNCPSFRFWFSEANRKVHALFGMHRPKYVPVPDHLRQRPKRAPLNPGDAIPGACKHIVLVTKYMKRQGMMA